MTAAQTVRAPRKPLSPRQVALLDTVVLWLVLATMAIVTMRATPAMDEDIWWHLRTGSWILTNHALPVTDIFSTQAAGKPWIAYTWLYDVLVSRIFAAFGSPGILGLTVSLFIAYTAWLVVFLARYVNLRRAMILALAAYLALMPLKSPRPWLFTILFFAVEFSLLWIAREENRPALLIPIVPLFIVWTNLHIQFVYGIGLIGLFALEASAPAWIRKSSWVEARPPLHSRWLWLLLGASCLSTLVNPYGWNIYRQVLEYATQTNPVALVQEMQSIPFRNPSNWIALTLICLGIFALGSKPRKNLVLLALFPFTCYFGFRSQRDIWFPVIVAVFALASSLREPKSDGFVPSRCYYWAAIPLSFAAALLFLALSSTTSNAALTKEVTRRFPDRACAFIESHRLPGPLYNSYDWGGYLIWRLPAMPVSIDGRANLYETYLETAAHTVTGVKKWSQDPALAKANTILLPQDGPLASILRVDSKYRLLYEDETAAVFKRVVPVGPGR